MNIILISIFIIVIVYIKYPKFEGYYDIKKLKNINSYERNKGPYVGDIVNTNSGDSLNTLKTKVFMINENQFLSETKKVLNIPKI